MALEDRVKKLEEENKNLLKEIDFVKFRFELLFDNSESCRYIIEREFTREQYGKIMDLMDETRNKIDNNEEVSSAEFENKLKQIKNDCDYHDAEILTRLFMEEGRWEEVFPALYGEFIKYKSYLERRKQGGNRFGE